MTTTVLIADGEPVLREGLAEMLAAQPDFVVVGEASNTRDAVAEARARRPDVALLALNLPLRGGLDAAARIRRACPATRLVVMVPPRYDAASAGAAHAVVSYGTRAEQVVASIRAVQPREPGASRAPRTQPLLASRRLTPREQEVCALLARAYSNREIEEALGIHKSAVKRHVRNVLCKLGAHNRVEVAIHAVRTGGETEEGGVT